MFSYRHVFHAGNHADILKHIVLVKLVEALSIKDKAFMLIDTHAGAGSYALDSAHAQRSGEADSGIGRLWRRTDVPAGLMRYMQLIRQFNDDGDCRVYPGSPWLVAALAREVDLLRFFELHPTDALQLEKEVAAMEREALSRSRSVSVKREDGFAGLKSLLPPPSRRGLVLIDPPYEDKNDYKKVHSAVADSLQRFSTGIYAVWYPQIARKEAADLPLKLSALPSKEWLNVTLDIGQGDFEDMNLAASGIFVCNPPFRLADELKAILPYLVRVLGRGAGASFNLQTGTKPIAPKARADKAFHGAKQHFSPPKPPKND
ncbi:MAG: 23S rRNA (adenine(2030)-N(6))-methyltransferase RlmJ [Burkholderiaceae bacterium]|jgi:23S rRNA (adenine2030-N6)-methyltransferase